jgi:chromosome segregation ATPase
MQPGIFESNVNRPIQEEVFASSESEKTLAVLEPIVVEDSILRKLRAAIDGYRSRVADWENAIRPIAAKQSVPSSTTIGLFGLGAVLCISVNAFAINSHTPTQEIALSNLGCTVLFVIAAISLFYDRVMRGYAQEVLVRRSAENATEIAIQLQALAEIQVDLQYRVKRLSRDLNDLSIEIENQNSLADELKEQNRIAQANQNQYDAKLVELRASIMGEASRVHRLQHSVVRLENERKELERSIAAHTDELFDVAARRETVSADLMVLESTRESTRAAWVMEQEEQKIEAQKIQHRLRELNEERSNLIGSTESIKADLAHLSELRSEMQAEIELIGEEQERRTAASIAAIAQLQAKIDGLQQNHDRNRAEFDQLQSAIRGAEGQRDGLLNRIGECTQAKAELEDVLVSLLEQIQENQDALANTRQAIANEEDRLEQRRALADREAIEADSRQKERTRVLQDLEREIERIARDRDSLQTEIDRLSGVRDAMDISIDELTNRLEMRTTDLRRKNTQLQEQADRLERLSEAIQKLTVRESEIRRAVDDQTADNGAPSNNASGIVQASILPASVAPPGPVTGLITPGLHASGLHASGIIIPGFIDTLPAEEGVTRSIHKPHFSALSRSYPHAQNHRDEVIGG